MAKTLLDTQRRTAGGGVNTVKKKWPWVALIIALSLVAVFIAGQATASSGSQQVILWVPVACDDPVPVDTGSTEGDSEGISTSVGPEGEFRLTYFDGENTYLVVCPLEMRMRPIEVGEG